MSAKVTRGQSVSKEEIRDVIRRAPRYKSTIRRRSSEIYEGTKHGSGGNLLRAARSGNLERLVMLLEEERVDINSNNSSGLNSLHLASKEGHDKVVLELLKRGIPINQATKRGNTALHIASLAGKIHVVQILVKYEADVNCQAQNAFTPLYMASQEGHEDIVDFLLKNGANQSLATEDGFTPLAVALQEGRDKVVALLLDNDVKGRVKLPALHIAARKDDVKAAALLLQNDHSADVTSKMMVNRTTESGFTALHIAAHYGNVNVAKLLLNRGAAVDFTAKNDITPLHVACKRGHTHFCSLLLDRNANRDARTRDGLAPIHCAARSGHKPVVKLLLDRSKTDKLPRTKNGLTALHMATQGGHTNIVKELIASNYDVDDSTLDYLTALHIAAHCGHVEATKILLAANAKVDIQALNGFTPLHVACKKNRINIVEILLERNASTEAVTESGLTPLHVACFMGHEQIVRMLLESGATLSAFNTRGETALHMATRSGQKDIVQLLMRNGANPDARKQESQTPLHLAARLDKNEIAKILLQHGAVVDEMMRDGYTPLHVASKEGHREMCEMLITNGASVVVTTNKGFTPLHLAAKYGRLEVVDLLLKKNASPDAAGKNGLTPLHVAAHYDNQQVALLLLKNGASAQAAGKNGYTALHIAAQKNQLEITITLLEYGANTTAKTRMDVTPLHLAAQAGHVDMCSLLLAKNADVNAKAKHGLTAMHLAAQDDRVAVAKILYDNKSLVDPLTKGGYTPLHTACYHGNIAMVEFLLSLGAKVNSKTKNGYTPLHLAAQQGYSSIVELLIKFGASANELTNNGNTALSLAKKLGYITCVESLTTVTTEVSTTEITDEKRKLNKPETVSEDFLSDASDDEDEGVVTDGNYLTSKELQELGDDSIVPATANMSYATRDTSITTTTITERTSWTSHTSDENAKGRERKYGSFLVSFLVDARGGAMRGSRHPDLRIIIPPKACGGPTRVTCRLARRQNITRSSAAMSAGIPLYEAEGKAARLIEVGQSGTGFLDKLHLPSKLPAFLEGEQLASRILQLGTKSDSFNGPIAIEIPHFGNTRGGQREVFVIRSSDGENWTDHKQICTDEEFCKKWGEENIESAEELSKRRVMRVITTDFPKYFALVSRAREDTCQVGPPGGVLTSRIHAGARSMFPEGALKKEIQVGIQVQSIPEDVCKRAVGTKAKASPIVTIEPRRRKFHKPITLTIPLPEGNNMKEYLSSTEDPTLRLLCSIAGGTDSAQWEDITGSTPLTFQEDCVSFTTTVSAKFWLIDCPHSSESSELAKRIYAEVVRVPYMGQFAVFSRTNDPNHADIRVYCTTDDRMDRTLEAQEGFVEVARSKDIDVTDEMGIYLEISGNIAPMSKSQQHSCNFIPFVDNTITFNAKIRDATQDPIGRLTFYRDPKGSNVHGARKPICSLNITLPPCDKEPDTDDEIIQAKSIESTPTRLSSEITSTEAKRRYYLIDPSSGNDTLRRVSAKIGLQWKQLAGELGLSNEDIWKVDKEMVNADPGERSFLMLFRWEDQQRDKDRDENRATLRSALRKIGREDTLQEPRRDLHDDHHDHSGFSALDAELGPAQDTPYHVSSPFPFSPKHNSTIKEETPNHEPAPDKTAPIYSHASDDYDDPSKPHFVYVESTSSVNESDLPTGKSDERPEDAVFHSSETNTVHDLAAQLMEEQLQEDMNVEPQVMSMQSEVNYASKPAEDASSDDEEEIRTTITRTIIVDEEDLKELNLPPTVVEVTNTQHGTVHVTREVTQTIVEHETRTYSSSSSSSSESD